MPPSISRRAFLLGLGGGAAAVGLAWGLSSSGILRPAPVDPYPMPECCTFVDYEGWMLTKVDKDRLMAQGGVKPLE
jgi:hypothetical protein